MKITDLLVFVVLALTTTQQSNQTGTIEGTVVDGKGEPIQSAKVYDAPLNVARIGKDHYVLSDEHGRFILRDVPVGKTMVIATKIEARYPDARFVVFSDNEVLPTVEVQADHTTSAVVVKLLARGGLLRGRIVDIHTRKAVQNARITLSRLDHPNWYLETDPAADGTFEFVIPSRPMHLGVSAQGYKTWTYEESVFSKNHAALTLAPDASQEIDVYLEPLKE